MHGTRGFVFALVVAAAIAVPGWALAAAPANDDLADAAELVGRVAFANGTNAEATKELGEPHHAGNAGGASIWYRWTAPAAGRTTVSTCGSEFNTLLGVYTGESPGLLDEVAANDDGCENQSRVVFEAVAGTTYRIAVDGFGAATGAVFLSLRLAPPNDDFADALALSGDTGSATGTTIGASSEDGEPDHFDVGWNSVWFEWIAPSTGWATFETCGSPFDTVLAAYKGAELSQLSMAAGNDDACELGSRVHFRVSEGTAYRIALAGYDGETGDFSLSWNRNVPPPISVAPPEIAGAARDGETLSATEGLWDGDPSTYAYAWGRCDEDEECYYIPRATSQTFTIRSIDVGYRIVVEVTASNAAGSSRALSRGTAQVVASPPANSVRPAVSGRARVGAIVVASPGAWIGTPPMSIAYQWQSCNGAGNNCRNLVGQVGQVMRVARLAPGSRIRVVVIATNAAGSASAPSAATPLVRGTRARRCIVPNVRGKTLRAARVAITRRSCRVGRIRRTFSNRASVGRVVFQTPRAGSRRAGGTRVHLVVSRGRRR